MVDEATFGKDDVAETGRREQSQKKTEESRQPVRVKLVKKYQHELLKSMMLPREESIPH